MINIEQTIFIIKDIDFSCYSAVSYDYDRVLSDDHYEQCQNDYCRCSTIENCVIDKINFTEFISVIKEHLDINIDTDSFNNEIYNICKDINTDDFDFDIVWGYYGEELNSIKLQSQVANKLANIFCLRTYRREKLKKINSSIITGDYIFDKYVKKILTEEYGYILDSLKNSKFTIIEVKTTDIIFPQKEYNEFVKCNNLSGYKNENDICGLVKNVNNKYVVIDGYHRINANLNREKIKVILAH